MANAKKNLGSGIVAPEMGSDIAEHIQHALAGAFALLGFATKDDVGRLDAGIERLNTTHREDINKLDAKIDKVEAGLNEKIDKVEAKVDIMGVRIWYVGAAIVTAFTLIAKFFMRP
jgi:hypothetical protein